MHVAFAYLLDEAAGRLARLAEMLDFLHRGLTSGLCDLHPTDDSAAVTIPFPEWQKIQAVQMLLARYLRAVADPDALVD